MNRLKLSKEKIKSISLDCIFITIGSIFNAGAINIFTVPNHIAPGGFTGVATVLNYLIGTNVGLTIFILNIPLFLFSFLFLKKDFVIKTAITTVFVSIVIGVFEFLPAYTENVLLASVFGGIANGIGLGMIYARGVTTGGSDLLAKLVQKKLPHIQFGQLLLAIDAIVVVFATIIFKDITSGFYSIITIFTFTLIVDKILVGMDTAKVAYITTEKHEEITQYIINDLDRTVTILDATGGYSKRKKMVLMCVVRNIEVIQLRKNIFTIDPYAFVIFSSANEVVGEGFKNPFDESKIQ